MKSVGNRSVILLVETDNKKIWYLLDLSLTHTIAQFLCSVIQINTNILRFEQFTDFIGICIQTVIVGLNRHNLHLDRCKPCRQITLCLLKNICHESVKGTEDCSMQNNRCLLLAVFVNVGQLEFRRQTEVELTCGQCDLITYSRLHIDIQLRAIESCFTDLFCVFKTEFVHNFTQCVLCLVPHLIIIMILRFVFRISQR